MRKLPKCCSLYDIMHQPSLKVTLKTAHLDLPARVGSADSSPRIGLSIVPPWRRFHIPLAEELAANPDHNCRRCLFSKFVIASTTTGIRNVLVKWTSASPHVVKRLPSGPCLQHSSLSKSWTTTEILTLDRAQDRSRQVVDGIVRHFQTC